jgi:hypothetical protein
MLNETQVNALRSARTAESHDVSYDIIEPIFREVLIEGNPENVKEFICRCPLALFRAEARGWLEINGHGIFDNAVAQLWFDTFKQSHS